METHAKEATKALNTADHKLKQALSQQEIDYTVLEKRLEQFRVVSGNYTLVQRWESNHTAAEQVEKQLWERHVQVNAKYKPYLKNFRDGPGQKKHVERRKAEKLYFDFVKASQRFYRAYIERLAANFSHVPKILEVARRLNKDGLVNESQQPVDGKDQRQSLENACRDALIRLGDLSRWRESEIKRTDFNWGPAVGYYYLALALDPAASICYNQLAIIHRYQESHFNAVYYFHRAASTKNPAPMAFDSLRIELLKLAKDMPEATYGMTDTSTDDMLSALVKRFLGFHSKCYAHPYDFVAFQQSATDILRLITLCFQETDQGPFDEFLKKACLINIAAENVASLGAKQQVLSKPMSTTKAAAEQERNIQSLILLQRFNIMTFQALLRILTRELEEGDAEDAQSDAKPNVFTPIARRVLPHLRQYSSWFLSTMHSLIDTHFVSGREALLQLCTVYSRTLNNLKDRIDVTADNSVGYLLDEDERTLSFTAFTDIVHDWRYNIDGTTKPTWRASGETKTSEDEFAEAHLRAQDLIVDALRLVQYKDKLNFSFAPILLEDFQFSAQRVPDPVRAPSPPPPTPKTTWRSRTHAHKESQNGITDSPPAAVVEKVVTLASETPKRHKKAKPSFNKKEPKPEAPQQATPSQAELLKEIPVRADPAPAHAMGPQPIEPEAVSKANLAAFGLNATPVVSSVSTPSAPEVQQHPAPTPSFDSSHVLAGTPQVKPTPMTAMDLVRSMQRVSPQPPPQENHVMPFGGMLNPSSTPSLEDRISLSPRPSSSQRVSPMLRTNGPPASSVVFAQDLENQQRAMQTRSSPFVVPTPTASWESTQQPTDGATFLRLFQGGSLPSPRFASSTSVVERPSQSPRSPAAPHGVIGQPRNT